MNYQVWTKDEYEGWKKVDCEDKEAAMGAIDLALRAGMEPLLTVEIPYRVSIQLEEENIGEVKKSETKPDKDPRGKGDRQVRRGDQKATPGLDTGSGDHSAGPGAGN